MELGETPVRVAHAEHVNCFAVATMGVSDDDNPTSYIRCAGEKCVESIKGGLWLPLVRERCGHVPER